VDMGTQQMMSVPYSLNAGALKLTVSATGDTLYSGNGNFVIIPGISAANCTLPSPGTITGTAGTCVGASTTLSNSISGGVWSSSNASIATVSSTGVVTGVTTGNATISYSITNSCGVAVATRDVTIIISTSIVGITGSGIVCAGGTTTLSHETPGGTWSSANTSVATIGSTGIVTGAASGTAVISYIVTYPYGCGSAVATRVVTVNALPTAGTITGIATVTAGSTTTFSNATTGGTWSSSATGVANVGSTGIVTGVAAGTATISYTVTNSCGSAVVTRVVTVNALTIGATYGGGKIAYILQPGDPGYIAGETHGLIAAPSDQSTGIQWGCYGTFVGSTSTAMGTGVANTAIISATCGAGTAARLCADLVLNGYDDWYLPSLQELGKLHVNKNSVGGFTNNYYWSSSEDGGNRAWSIGFINDVTNSFNKNQTFRVRAVRSFSFPEAIIGTSFVCIGSTSILSSATTGGTWSSSNTGVATVSSSGVVSGVASGTAIISYTATESFGTSTTTRIVMVNSLPSAYTITGTATVTAGSTTTLSNAITGGTWSSSNTGIATLGSTGLVTGVAAGTANISYTVTSSCGSAVATRVVTVNTASLTIGAAYGGGAIAYILQPSDPGYIADEIHGIIVAPTDQSTSISWYSSSTITGATDTTLGTGLFNTNAIVAALGAGSYAAKLCADLVFGGYSDWYLPSKDELQKIYINRSAIGGIANTNYWSSSEYNHQFARVISFSNGTTNNYSKNHTAVYTRAVRSFSFPEAITGTSFVCTGSTSTLSSATTGGTWSSSNTGVATVSSSGVVSGVASGAAIISYTANSSLGTSTTTRIVTVNALPSAGTITGTATVCAGSTSSLSNTTTGGAWSSSATDVATVGGTGVVTGVTAGTATISYSVANGCGSAVATRIVTVNTLPSAGTITGTATVTAGSTTTLSNATTGGTWSSSATGIATIGSTGVVSGVAAGTATISYTVTNTCGSAVATRVVTVSAGSTTVGSTFGGGVIAYIYVAGDPGYVAGETHGLIAAPSDQSTGIEWGCYGTTVGGTSTALGTGAANTAIVSSACGAGTAARLCADLVLNGYSDWYLPSRDELYKLYINRSSIGGFATPTGGYWSSSESESDADIAWFISFISGSAYSTYFKYYALYVRAVRAF